VINVFTVTFDQFNAYLLNKNINFFQINLTDPKLLNGCVLLNIDKIHFKQTHAFKMSSFSNIMMTDNTLHRLLSNQMLSRMRTSLP